MLPKKLFIILILVLFFSAVPKQIIAQTLTLNLEGVLTGGYELSYDHLLKNNMIVANEVTYQNSKTGILYALFYLHPVNINSWQNISFSSGIRKYFSDDFTGVFITGSVSLGYGYVDFEYHSLKKRFGYVNDPILKGLFYDAIFKIGYEWMAKKRFSVAVEAGVRYRENNINFSNLEEYKDYEIWGIQDEVFTSSSSDIENGNYYKGFSPTLSFKLRYHL